MCELSVPKHRQLSSREYMKYRFQQHAIIPGRDSCPGREYAVVCAFDGCTPMWFDINVHKNLPLETISKLSRTSSKTIWTSRDVHVTFGLSQSYIPVWYPNPFHYLMTESNSRALLPVKNEVVFQRTGCRMCKDYWDYTANTPTHSRILTRMLLTKVSLKVSLVLFLEACLLLLTHTDSKYDEPHFTSIILLSRKCQRTLLFVYSNLS